MSGRDPLFIAAFRRFRPNALVGLLLNKDHSSIGRYGFQKMTSRRQHPRRCRKSKTTDDVVKGPAKQIGTAQRQGTIVMLTEATAAPLPSSMENTASTFSKL